MRHESRSVHCPPARATGGRTPSQLYNNGFKVRGSARVKRGPHEAASTPHVVMDGVCVTIPRTGDYREPSELPAQHRLAVTSWMKGRRKEMAENSLEIKFSIKIQFAYLERPS